MVALPMHCVAKGTTNKNLTTWRPFAFPHGAVYLHARHLGCDVPAEANRSNAWLPVVSTAYESAGSKGLFFYYARGCSDLLWHVGRQFAARNRCAAAIHLERLANGGTDAEATERVAAAFFREHDPRDLRLRSMLQTAQTRARSWFGGKVPSASGSMQNSTLAGLYAECARGIHGVCDSPPFAADGSLRPCECAGGWWRVHHRKRAFVVSELAGNDHLNVHILQLMHRLGYTTLQLLQQPQGGGGLGWSVELMDARNGTRYARHLRKALLTLPAAEFTGRVARLDGITGGRKACVPWVNFTRCMACEGSGLESVCREP